MSDPSIGLFEAMYTQRAIRSFKPDPVPREALEKLVEAATKAPSGANWQPWAFIVVDDPDVKSGLSVIGRRNFDALYEALLKRQLPGDPPPVPNLKEMVRELERIPAWIVVCAEVPEGGGVTLESLPSIFPAVQNLLLAARGLGLGATLTTFLGNDNRDQLRALLELPTTLEPVAFVPIGYPDKHKYGPTTRRPLSEVLYWNRWEPGRLNSARVAHR